MKRLSRSNMCIEPPRPLHSPSTRPNSSAMTRLGAEPGASVWPCERYVEMRQAWSRSVLRGGAVGGDGVVRVGRRGGGAHAGRLPPVRERRHPADLRLRVHLAGALL